MSNTIRLRVTGRQDEFEAASALSPGHLVEMTSAGTIQNHSTADAKDEVIIACEDSLQGGTVDDAYSAGDIVTVFYPQPGDVFKVMLKDGQTITKGDQLESDGDGTFVTLAAGVAIVVADESLSPSGANALIRVRAL